MSEPDLLTDPNIREIELTTIFRPGPRPTPKGAHIPDRLWSAAAKRATEAGHRRGGHEWWEAIRAELGLNS
jgi:hypothetical protein